VSFFSGFLLSYFFLRVFVFLIYLKWLHFMGIIVSTGPVSESLILILLLASWTALIFKAMTDYTRHHKGPLHELPDLLRFFLPVFPCVTYYFTFFFFLVSFLLFYIVFFSSFAFLFILRSFNVHKRARC